MNSPGLELVYDNLEVMMAESKAPGMTPFRPRDDNLLDLRPERTQTGQ
jgi:hypothetical protein